MHDLEMFETLVRYLSPGETLPFHKRLRMMVHLRVCESCQELILKATLPEILSHFNVSNVEEYLVHPPLDHISDYASEVLPVMLMHPHKRFIFLLHVLLCRECVGKKIQVRALLAGAPEIDPDAVFYIDTKELEDLEAKGNES